MSEYEHHVRRDNAAVDAEWHCGRNDVQIHSIGNGRDAAATMSESSCASCCGCRHQSRGSVFQFIQYIQRHLNFLWGPLAHDLCEGSRKHGLSLSCPALPSFLSFSSTVRILPGGGSLQRGWPIVLFLFAAALVPARCASSALPQQSITRCMIGAHFSL
jgi:hypothetical protein